MHKTSFIGTCWFLGSLVVSSAWAAAPPADAPAEYLCYYTETPPKIDGRGDDDVWKVAKPVHDFTMAWVREGSQQPKAGTRAKLLWDREYVYFFADMDDADLFADIQEHDGNIWTNDVFELFFKPAEDKTAYYEFEVSAANVHLDLFIPLRNKKKFPQYKVDGVFEYQTAVQLHGTLNKDDDQDQGWSCEGRIPWKDFTRTGGRPQADERWRFALCRGNYSREGQPFELSSSAALKSKPIADFHLHEDYTPIRFVNSQESPRPEGAKPAGLATLKKVNSSRVVGSPDPPKPYTVERIFEKLPIQAPAVFRKQPGSDLIWIVTETGPWRPATLSRFRNVPDAAELETLITPDKDHLIYDLCFHPKFLENGYVFMGHNGPFGGGTKHSRITRFHVDPKPPHKFDPKSATVILEWESGGHDGTAMAFGPDGMFYVTSGDGSTDSDENVTGQDLSRLYSKLLRIDIDHPEPGKTYSVPQDNPFFGQKDVRPETYAYGLRNPWRLDIDATTGQIWIGNNGQDLWESVYLVERGANYGWSIVEGEQPFMPERKQGPTPISKPVANHSHSESRSLTGGFVYRGSKFPELVGAYLYGDYSTGKIWAIKHDGKQVIWHEEIADTPLQITGIIEGNDGDIWLLDFGGHSINRLVPSPKDVPQAPFPRKLSDSGLFTSIAQHSMADGVIPYSVNSPLWSDGAYKERFLALPFKDGGEAPIEYKGTGSWNFPNDTVLIKSFALENVAGDKAPRRWVETRFLVRQQNEWVGYSYEWNDEQTDAMLVANEGRDRVFEIRDPAADGGLRKQTWHYPSRTECMVCHSRASNFILGLQTAQMNRDHDYGGVVDNQLRAFEQAGLFRINAPGETNAFLRSEFAKQLRLEAGERVNDPKVEAEIEQKTNQHFAGRQLAKGQRTPVAQTGMLCCEPSKLPRLADPYDASAALEARARSYLHVNCAACHIPAGGGNAKMNLGMDVPLSKMSLIGDKPQHATFGINDARLVAPGHPDRSVLLYRISRRGQGQMPQLATSIVDQRAVDLMKAWIANLPQKPAP